MKKRVLAFVLAVTLCFSMGTVALASADVTVVYNTISAGEDCCFVIKEDGSLWA